MISIKKLNPLKRKIFKGLCNSFQNSRNLNQLRSIPKNSTIKVLIIRPNHRLGNQLLITPLIQEIVNEFRNCKIDLAVNGTISNQIYANFSCIDKTIQFPKKPFNNILSYLLQCFKLFSKKYDLVIAANESSSSSKIFTKLSRGKYKIYNCGNINNIEKPAHIAQYPIYNFRKALNNQNDFDCSEYPQLSINLTEKEKEKGAKIIDELFETSKQLICIFTYATGSKCYSKKWWNKFYKKLVKKFPDSNILEILPVENISQLDFKCTHFYGKNLREIASIIDNANLFIGADSGMMHLAASTSTPIIGLFSRQNKHIYGPYGKGNASVYTKEKKTKKKILKKANQLSQVVTAIA